MWIGLLVGVVVGAALWRIEGAIVLGFFGWLVGVIVDSRKRGKAEVKKPTVTAQPESLHVRVAKLEAQVARLEKQLADVVPAEAGTQSTETPAYAGVTTAPDLVPAADVVPAEAGTQATEPPAYAGVTTPPPPPKPNPIVAWFLGGNTIARVGLVILFIGLAFLLKFAADNNMLPVELRVAAVAAAGLALLITGWRLREKRPAYALAMQGAGVGVLYLTTFGAYRLWHLIPPEAAFFLLAAIAIFSAILAIKQDAMVLAVFGSAGGFLAPILASTGNGSHVALFSYFLVLNLGIAAIAWYKAWRPLNVVGFAFTFLIGLAWGFKYYRPEYFDSVEPFLVVFFVLYVAIAILFARRAPPQLNHFVDGTIVFGVPLAAFGLQAGLTKGIEFALSFSALGMGALYMILAALLQKTRRENYALLAETFIALGVVFATVAVPLALDARWTSAAWALEGAAIVWVGVRQNRLLARAFGMLLQFAAGWAYVEGYVRGPVEGMPLVDAPFVGALLVSLAGLFTNRLLQRPSSNVTAPERTFAPFAFAWGLAWAVFAGHHEILAFVPREMTLNAHVAFLAALAFLMGLLSLRLAWTEAAWGARLLIPALIPFAVISLGFHRHPFGNIGWIAWPAAFLVHLWILKRLEPESTPRYARILHVLGTLLAAAVGAKELNWIAADATAHHTAWSVAAVAVVPALLVLLASTRAADGRWPVLNHERAYRIWAAGIIAVGLVAWSLYANVTHDGDSEPLPYLPLLNALDLAHIFAALSLIFAWLAARRSSLSLGSRGVSLPLGSGGVSLPLGGGPGRGLLNVALVVAGAIAFIWLNGILLRTLHHWADVPYTFNGVRRSVLAQASLSIFWSILALGTMVFATQTARRALWMVGAALMGVVVVKLFVVDLSRVAGIERIVSFIAVGVLMLVIGYFSPVPPRKPEPTQ